MRMLAGILYLSSVTSTNAQTVVKDKEDGSPVAYAHVLNQNAEYIGQTDAEGKLPDDLQGATAISISHVAYQPEKRDVGKLGREILLTPATFNIGEAVVSIPKPYCIRLSGFKRDYGIADGRISKKKQLEEPIGSLSEGVGCAYILLNGSKDAKWYYHTERKLVKDILRGGENSTLHDLKPKSVVERAQNSKNMTLRNKGSYQQVLEKGHVVGNVVTDSADHVIRVDYDELYPDTVKSYNLLLAKMKIYELKNNCIYRLDDDDYVSQAGLIRRKSFGHFNIKVMGSIIDFNAVSELFVSKAEYLSKEDYKKAMAEEKARAKSKRASMTAKELDNYMTVHQIPAITEEMRHTIEVTKEWEKNNSKKK